jgi:hypothetical protein
MNSWPELSPETNAQLEAALARGNKIEAIKIYRKATNSDLKEARDAIERADPAAGPRSSQTTSRNGSSWLVKVLLLAITAIVLIVILLFTR